MWYNHVVFLFNKKHWAFKIVKSRRKDCFSCPYFDPYGESKNAIIPGTPSCSICGCNIFEKTASLSSECAKVELGLEPEWGPAKKTMLQDELEHKLTVEDYKNGKIY